MGYRICEADASEKLQKQVKLLIEAGWRPLGGLSVVQAQSGKWWFYQAMIQEAGVPGHPSKPNVPGSGDFD